MTLPDLVAICRFILATLLFVLPGFGVATWLHGRMNLHWTFRTLLGFGYSLAVFAMLAWPYLWWQGSFASFQLVLGFAWIFWCIAGGLGYRSTPAVPDAYVVAERGPRWTASAARQPLFPAFFWSAYLIGVALLVVIPFRLQQMPVRSPWWISYGIATACLLVAGCWYAWRTSGANARVPQDDAPSPHWFTTTVVGLILLQALSAAAFDRPDWDDCYYLAAVLDYQQTDELNSEEPTHREGFPVSPINRLLAWELWGAVLCALSGMSPMEVFHTFLPPLLVLLAYAGYAQVLRELLPKRWVMIALLGVAAYHLWGVSSHNNPANYLLTRVAQGKGVLLHLAFPAIVVLVLRCAERPSFKAWLGLLLAATFGLAASSSAVFLLPMLLGCLGCATLVFAKQNDWLKVLSGGALAAVPAVVYGLVLHGAVSRDAAIAPAPSYGDSTQVWFDQVAMFCGHGSAELTWLLTLPLTAGLILSRKAKAYLLIFPLILVLTFNLPWWTNLVMDHLTSQVTYFRIFWLYPVAIGLGCALALFGRQFGMTIASYYRVDPFLPATLISTVGIVASAFSPGLYVWGERNVAIIAPPRMHPFTPNWKKMPPELVEIADYLLAQPDPTSFRILALEDVTNYLTPYDRRFRLVETRSLYTLYGADMAGKREEGQRRHLLGLILYGQLPQEEEDRRPFQATHPFYRIPPFPEPPQRLTQEVMQPWLDDLAVRYAITSPDTGPNAPLRLRALGFQAIWELGEYALWERP